MSSATPGPPPSAPSDTGTTPSRYALGSAANMVRSLAVILGILAVLVAIVPRVESVQQPAVDAAAVVSDAVRQSGLPFEAPVGLPSGWSATNARYAAWTDGLMTWQAGWTTPKGGYVAIHETRTASTAWLQAATSNAVPSGTVDIGGRTWTRYADAGRSRTSLVLLPSGDNAANHVATVVTAMSPGGDTAELTAFVEALRPAQPR